MRWCLLASQAMSFRRGGNCLPTSKISTILYIASRAVTKKSEDIHQMGYDTGRAVQLFFRHGKNFKP